MEMDRSLGEFRDNGYTVVADAITTEHRSALDAALEELTARGPERIHNVADILGLRDEFLDLIDLPTVLPLVQQLLGNNIWVNHSHYNVNPPDSRGNARDRETGYGWHRDGGAINQDLPKPGPLLSIKVGFYLSDLTETGRGQTYVIAGSHKTDQATPKSDDLPETARAVCVAPGSALLFDRRMIHSIRSENSSDITRKAVFIQYAYRWMGPVDAMTVEHVRDRCNPVRLQLLGLAQNYGNVDGAAGRASTYYPRPRDVPLANRQPNFGQRLSGALRRRIARLTGRR